MESSFKRRNLDEGSSGLQLTSDANKGTRPFDPGSRHTKELTSPTKRPCFQPNAAAMKRPSNKCRLCPAITRRSRPSPWPGNNVFSTAPTSSATLPSVQRRCPASSLCVRARGPWRRARVDSAAPASIPPRPRRFFLASPLRPSSAALLLAGFGPALSILFSYWTFRSFIYWMF